MKNQTNKRDEPLIAQVMSKEDAIMSGMNMYWDCTAGTLFNFSSHHCDFAKSFQ